MYLLINITLLLTPSVNVVDAQDIITTLLNSLDVVSRGSLRNS